MPQAPPPSATDASGQLVSRTDSFGFTTEFTYDAAGNLTTLTYPDNKVVTYTYDGLNRLDTVTNWLNQTATYTYDAAGRLTGLENFNNTLVNFNYDNANRLTSLDNTRTDDTVVASFAFTLDANGNRTSIIEEFPLAAMPSAANTNYAYNTEKNRLESAGTLTFTHDPEGQLATKGSNRYAFDYAHRLKTVTGTNPASFVYDGAGNRITATRDTVTTRYIYDPAGNLLATADANNTILSYFIHGQGLLAMVTPTDQTYCYHFDGTGNTIAMTDNSQYSVNSYAYTPFGILLEEQETVPQPFKYVGQFGVMAEPDGLYYMRARYYDPQVGRFISEDPIGFGGGDVNLFAYVLNNPIMFVDPWGLCSEGSNSTLKSVIGIGLLGVLVADDVTGIGAADDFLIPVVISAIGITAHQALQSSGIRQTDPADLGPLKGAPELGGWQMPSGDPHKDGRDYWKKPSNWNKIGKWQKTKWWAGKIGGALTGAGGVGM